MHPRIEELLREAGEDLRASHDEEIIREVLADVEQLEGENADLSADILRLMSGIE